MESTKRGAGGKAAVAARAAAPRAEAPPPPPSPSSANESAGAGARAASAGRAAPAAHNRVREIMAHGWRYAFHPTDRLARDVGVSPRTVRRLLAGDTRRPAYALVEAVTRALSRDLRLPRALPAREVFSPDGTYPTPSTCALCDCDGCLPEAAHDRHGRLRPAFRGARPGDWCRHRRPAADRAGAGRSEAAVRCRNDQP